MTSTLEKKANKLTHESYEWSLSTQNSALVLNCLSPTSKEWHTYEVGEDYCTCEAGSRWNRYCYHRVLLSQCGGEAVIRRQVERSK